MKKLIFIISSIVLSSIIVFAQFDRDNRTQPDKGNEEYREIFDCYKNTDSFLTFRLCIEDQSLPDCPPGLEIRSVCPRGDCRCKRTEPLIRDRRDFEKDLNISDGDSRSKSSMRFPNENPETFESNW